jgi:phage terminase large subunit-like protein
LTAPLIDETDVGVARAKGNLQAVRVARRMVAGSKFDSYFPDTGPCRRELYPKHMEFFAAGALYKERLFMAANRCGKSESGAYETACHLTGLYPTWWVGKRFDGPIQAWACGTNSETTRDIVQAKLLGPIEAEGTGMIAKSLISHSVPRKSGIAGSIESVWVKHVSGRFSLLGLKSYEQGRKSFEGTSKHLIWCDEEPPEDCYTEMLYRTATVRGIMMTTFTPLQGMSAVVKGFLEPPTEEAKKYKWFIQAGWQHVPHIPEEEKEALIATSPAYQIKARTLGEPSLGAGAIYPIAEEEITVPRFDIPDSWPRAFGLDVGWQRTAAIWGARDPATGIVYLYSEHYQSANDVVTHAWSIKQRGNWIQGVIDPASQQSGQMDGRKLIEEYRRCGVLVQPAENAVETGIKIVWEMLVGGRLKVMDNLFNWLAEFRKYCRKEDKEGRGKIVKRDDHLMDATRYLCVSGLALMKIKPVRRVWMPPKPASENAWMG